MDIQWYPGHMAKTKRMMEENIRLVDVVVEVVDARIPYSSKNPYLDQLWSRRPRVIVMNKIDLADLSIVDSFKKWYESQGYAVVSADSLKGKGIREIALKAQEIVQAKRKTQSQALRQDRPIRMMITGIPNVGKSTVINQMAHRSDAAKTGNKPGVTKGKQWIRLDNWIQLLDTPGMLWPKFEDPEIGYKIAFIGSISDTILDTYTLAVHLLDDLKVRYGERLIERYKLEAEDLEQGGDHLIEAIARKRGHLKSGSVPDVERTAVMLVDEFRSGKLGRICLETMEVVSGKTQD